MKFLIDAHLPIALKSWLTSRGHDVIHTRDLPKKSNGRYGYYSNC